ncbi:peroxide stress protein YaaA [Burkholderiaceae bacterium FT117]|uniref:peroxide stress protein YaaA n=1 Tax=Zeimonas sediminis TaxID=2944268 RepID=UPI002342EDE4|nr:peroxide stress protein YaaA [Zeimonas sediminis]MCM5569690.1 peroxide stress protein YaaA [Zeimonas sediminis]
MLIVLSPAKTLDYDTPPTTDRHTTPAFLDQSEKLAQRMREFDPAALAELMSISDALAALNVARFAEWSLPFAPGRAKQAVLAFAGDVYDGLDAKTLDAAALDWTQDHVRILSGLYGLLRPLDLMLPYRLEMGTRVANERGRDLYAFWGDRLAAAISGELDSHDRPVLVNLASDEYFKAVAPKALRHPVVQPVFQERRGGAWKIVSFSAKRARGAMTRFAIDERIDDAEGLKDFDRDGYRFDAEASDDRRWYFRREAP